MSQRVTLDLQRPTWTKRRCKSCGSWAEQRDLQRCALCWAALCPDCQRETLVGTLCPTCELTIYPWLWLRETLIGG